MNLSVNQSEQSDTRLPAPIYRRLPIVFLLVVFGADLLTPLGLAHGLLYLPVIVLVTLTRDQEQVLRVGLWALLLCSLGMLLGELPEGFALVAVVANRLLSLAAIGITLALCLQRLATRSALERISIHSEQDQNHLKRLQTTLDMLSRQADIGYWFFENRNQKFQRSELASQIVGLTPGEPPPEDGALSFFPEPGRQQVVAAFEQCVQRGKPYSEQLPINTRSGQQRLIKTAGRPLFNDEGQQIGVVGTLQDITGRNRSGEQFAENVRALQQQLDSLPTTVWSALPDGSIDYFNQALSDFSGVARETLSAPGEWLALLHPDDQERCILTWTRCVQNGQPYQIQFRIRRYDGKYCWHQVQATPARDLQGSIFKWYGSAVQIPESAVNV